VTVNGSHKCNKCSADAAAKSQHHLCGGGRGRSIVRMRTRPLLATTGRKGHLRGKQAWHFQIPLVDGGNTKN